MSRATQVGMRTALAATAATIALCCASAPSCSAGGSADGDTNPGGGSPTGIGAGGTGGGIHLGGSGTGGAEPCVEDVDLVFVLDISSSMLFVLNQLRDDIGGVVQSAVALGHGDPHFGLVTFVDNALLDPSGPLSGGLVHTEASSLQAAFQHYADVYTAFDRNPADGPDGPTLQNPICEENANDALYLAATTFPWREGTSHVIIVATDDTFLERPDNYGDRDGDGLTDKTDFPREGDYPAQWTLAETVGALEANGVRVFAFTRLVPPGPFDPTRCGTGRRLPWEAISHGWSAPYAGQPPIPDATSARNYDLDAVRNGSLALADTINEVVVESNCNPIPE